MPQILYCFCRYTQLRNSSQWTTELNSIINNTANIVLIMKHVPQYIFCDEKFASNFEFSVTRQDNKPLVHAKRNIAQPFEWDKTFERCSQDNTIYIKGLKCHATTTKNERQSFTFSFSYKQQVMVQVNDVVVITHNNKIERSRPLGRKPNATKRAREYDENEEEEQVPCKKQKLDTEEPATIVTTTPTTAMFPSLVSQVMTQHHVAFVPLFEEPSVAMDDANLYQYLVM